MDKKFESVKNNYTRRHTRTEVEMDKDKPAQSSNSMEVRYDLAQKIYGEIITRVLLCVLSQKQ